MVLNSVKKGVKNNMVKLWIDCDYNSQVKFFFPDWQKKKDFFETIVTNELPPKILNYQPAPWI